MLMRLLLILVFAVAGAAAQSPSVQLNNISRPGKAEYQIGDRFQIVITGPRSQPISVRTSTNNRTDWGPIIGETNADGQRSITGQFEASDFGDWSEVWTVGGKLAAPIVRFSVSAPCIEGGPHFIARMGALKMETCETAEGTRSFVTPSDGEPFRTPDGRITRGRTRSQETPEQYRMETLQALVLNLNDKSSEASGLFGD
ncbi:MAG TPA: hypothetical protein VH325_06500, partial [Bryobacteraceae bacterium]|nr:hypothetical protein [Bryobacteraceae bacterium]